MYITQWQEKEKNRESDEIDLRDFLDMMGRKNTGVINRIEALYVLGNYKIKWYQEHNNEDRKEKEDVELKENILQGVENDKENEVKKEVKMSKKQRRNQVLEQIQNKKKENKRIKKKKKKEQNIKRKG